MLPPTSSIPLDNDWLQIKHQELKTTLCQEEKAARNEKIRTVALFILSTSFAIFGGLILSGTIAPLVSCMAAYALVVIGLGVITKLFLSHFSKPNQRSDEWKNLDFCHRRALEAIRDIQSSQINPADIQARYKEELKYTWLNSACELYFLQQLKEKGLLEFCKHYKDQANSALAFIPKSLFLNEIEKELDSGLNMRNIPSVLDVNFEYEIRVAIIHKKVLSLEKSVLTYSAFVRSLELTVPSDNYGFKRNYDLIIFILSQHEREVIKAALIREIESQDFSSSNFENYKLSSALLGCTDALKTAVLNYHLPLLETKGTPCSELFSFLGYEYASSLTTAQRGIATSALLKETKGAAEGALIPEKLPQLIEIAARLKCRSKVYEIVREHLLAHFQRKEISLPEYTALLRDHIPSQDALSRIIINE